MKKSVDIVCKLTPSIWVALANVRENMGHDDSLPYQADIFVYDKDNCPENDIAFKKIGSIWNDGWGGESNIDVLAAPRCKEYIQRLEEECTKHQVYLHGKPFAIYYLKDVCDYMACLVVDNPEQAKKGTLLYLMDDNPLSQGGIYPLAWYK